MKNDRPIDEEFSTATADLRRDTEKERIASLSYLLPSWIVAAAQGPAVGAAPSVSARTGLLFEFPGVEMPPQGWEQNARMLAKILGGIEVDQVAVENWVLLKLGETLAELGALERTITETEDPFEYNKKWDYLKMMIRGGLITDQLTGIILGGAKKDQGALAGMEVMWLLRNFRVCTLSVQDMGEYIEHLAARFAS